MIELSVSHVVCALQGGVRMSFPLSSSHEPVTPLQVWPALSLDVRQSVIGLLAELALHVVAARQQDEHDGKEFFHAQQKQQGIAGAGRNGKGAHYHAARYFEGDDLVRRLGRPNCNFSIPFPRLGVRGCVNDFFQSEMLGFWTQKPLF